MVGTWELKAQTNLFAAAIRSFCLILDFRQMGENRLNAQAFPGGRYTSNCQTIDLMVDFVFENCAANYGAVEAIESLLKLSL